MSLMTLIWIKKYKWNELDISTIWLHFPYINTTKQWLHYVNSDKIALIAGFNL
jgi:hypothetical protein